MLRSGSQGVRQRIVPRSNLHLLVALGPFAGMSFLGAIVNGAGFWIPQLVCENSGRTDAAGIHEAHRQSVPAAPFQREMSYCLKQRLKSVEYGIF